MENKSNNLSKIQNLGIEQPFELNITTQDPVSNFSYKTNEINSDTRKRVRKGCKAAKAEKFAKIEKKKEENKISEAFSSWNECFKEATKADIEAADRREKKNSEQKMMDFEIKKREDELEAAKVLFIDDDSENQQYRKALKRKRLRLSMQ